MQPKPQRKLTNITVPVTLRVAQFVQDGREVIHAVELDLAGQQGIHTTALQELSHAIRVMIEIHSEIKPQPNKRLTVHRPFVLDANALARLLKEQNYTA